ncbi:MAG: leucyl aminopeptidase [Algicola sp.]|nr:leucyl aminopeptidase [Algicola sp.]
MRTLPLLLACFVLSVSAFAEDRKTTPKPTTVTFSASVQTADNIVLGVFEDGKLGSEGSRINTKTNGGLAHAIKNTEFDGKAMSTKVIPAPMGSKYSQIMLVGLGEKSSDSTPLIWQEIGGNAVQKAVEAFKSAPTMVFDVSAEALANIAFGAKLGSYYFDKYYTDAKRHKSQAKLTIVGNSHSAAAALFNGQLNPVANAMVYTRNISNEPANMIYPQSFVDAWSGHFKGMANVSIKVIDEKEMLKLGMGAIYGVGRGSARPPRIMIVEYKGGTDGKAPVMFVGKGITFDSGGISLKNPSKMWNMKFDMSGAASAIGAVYALAGRKAKVNVVGIAALAENMPDSNAQRPGDVVTSMSGKTIQIRSTDAEGRLVLADGLYYGDITYNPAVLIDLATLTGSAVRALGKDYAALFSRHQDLIDKLMTVSKTSGEGLWHLPLNDKHFKAIENKVADIMNSGPDAPGASAGAAFVGTFVRPETIWAHLDIAGVAYSDKATPTKSSPGSAAYGVRLLDELVRVYYEEK